MSRCCGVHGSSTINALLRCWPSAFQRPLRPSLSFWHIITQLRISCPRPLPFGSALANGRLGVQPTGKQSCVLSRRWVLCSSSQRVVTRVSRPSICVLPCVRRSAHSVILVVSSRL